MVQPVKISRQIGNEVVIASGIKAGDQVITEIPQALQPGATVRVAGADGNGGREGQGQGQGQGQRRQDRAKARPEAEGKSEG